MHAEVAARVVGGERAGESGWRRIPADRTICSCATVSDSLKVDVGAAEKHSMGHTPLMQRGTSERVDR